MTWGIHNHVIHPICAVLRFFGFKRTSFRLHDWSVPGYAGHLWTID